MRAGNETPPIELCSRCLDGVRGIPAASQVPVRTMPADSEVALLRLVVCPLPLVFRAAARFVGGRWWRLPVLTGLKMGDYYDLLQDSEQHRGRQPEHQVAV
mgnify:CR=1 FL=1